MPHLDSQPFTVERMTSIVNQTFQDWELIIVDSQSSDGSREILQDFSKRDARIHLLDGPRDGIYTNINRAILQSHGKYIYVATSDDTMAPDCLLELVNALEENPACGIAHCCLEIIDEKSKLVAAEHAWENYLVQQFLGEWINRPHIRRAPHDGLLHLGFFTVYTSLTQLLIRRTVFQRVGYFRTDCGSHADFDWGLKVGLTEDLVHLSKRLATWRRHPRQATQPARVFHARAKGEFLRIVKQVIGTPELCARDLARGLRSSGLMHYYLVDEMKARLSLAKSTPEKIMHWLRYAGAHPAFAIRWMITKIVFRKRITGRFDEELRVALKRLKLENLVSSLPIDASTPTPVPEPNGERNVAAQLRTQPPPTSLLS